MSKEGHIDLEKIASCAETLSSIEDVMNAVDLSENFTDVEEILKHTNFEHANCISYKESMDIIYEDLVDVKKKVNLLAEALRRTKLNYTKISTFSEKDIKEFTEIYKETPASEDLLKLVNAKTGDFASIAKKVTADLPENQVTTIPLPERSENVTTIPAPVEEPEIEQPINTVPIGIAIGATGIAGSIGAVIVDDIYSKKEKHNKKVQKSDIYIEDYNEDDILEDDSYYASNKQKEQNDMGVVQGPYRAARMEREADRYYGNQLEGWMLSDDENEYVDEDDDDFDN